LAVGLPFTANAQLSPAEKLIGEGHWKRARALVDARIKEAPNDPLAIYLLSQIHNAFGDHSTPLSLAEKAVALDAKTAKYHRQYAEALGVMAQHANMLQQLILARRFRKEIDLAIKLDPHDTQALGDLLEYYLLAPGIAGGDPEKAEEIAERITQINPAEGFLAKARLAEFHKQPAAVEAALRQAAAVQPPSYRAQVGLARYLLGLEHPKPDMAEGPAKVALQIDKGRVDAYTILAEIYAIRSDWTALDAILAQAAKEVPDDLAPQYYAAERLLDAKGDASRAERYLRAYLTQEPEGNEPSVGEAHWKLGRALEARGQVQPAIAEMEQAVRLDPGSPAAHDLKRLRNTRTIPASNF
jgi:tetratricopeptide (TPR) repeat protein